MPDPLFIFKVLQMEIFGFITEGDWIQNCCHGNGCYLVPFMMNIDGSKFEEHHFNTPRDTLDSVIYLFVERLMTSSLSSFAYYKKLNISIMKGDILKRKMPFIFISKSLKNKQYSIRMCIGRTFFPNKFSAKWGCGLYTV